MMQENYNNLNETVEDTLGDFVQSYAFLFVNSSSGSCVGDSLIKSHIKQIKVSTSGKLTTFLIYDLYSEKERKMAFEEAKRKCKVSTHVYILICGGDGTVEWVIEESLKSKVNYESVIFSVIPIGTGNDFAKSIGWGDFEFTVAHEKFQELALELSKARVGYFDIWESSIECFESGSIVEIKNGQEVERSENRLVKNFTNYFGIGTDAQIAYIAQRLRARTIALKKIAYGFAGFLSFWMFCGGLKRKISEILQVKTRDLVEEVPRIEHTMNEIKTEMSVIEEIKEQTTDVKISNWDCCMTFLNSTSSMDLQEIWKTPHIANSTRSDESFKEQCVDDGMIEIVSYRNEISLWFERAFHMAKKVEQGNGPFIINFKEPNPDKSFAIYIHINGQPYRLTNPKSITVCQSPQFPSGKIRVLYRKP